MSVEVTVYVCDQRPRTATRPRRPQIPMPRPALTGMTPPYVATVYEGDQRHTRTSSASQRQRSQ